MKVFLSWSKERSRLVAELFNGWIKCVIQSVNPWISTQDIQDGELWFPAINSQIAEISTGVIFITQENKAEPWILFEAGGLAKGLDKNRLVLMLVDLQPNDLLLSPLTAFNQTKPDRDGMRKLVGNINRWIPSPLDPATLDSVFDKFWPDFETGFAQILESTPPPPEAQKSKHVASDLNNDMLAEILKTVRGLNSDKQLDREISESLYFAGTSMSIPLISQNRAHATLLSHAIKNNLTVKDLKAWTLFDIREIIKESYPGSHLKASIGEKALTIVIDDIQRRTQSQV